MKLIIFDLDGVLVEAKNIHFDALNESLGPKYSIEWNEHLSKYDGLKTNQKLEMLTKEKGLPIELYKQVWDEKQRLTLKKLSDQTNQTHPTQCMSSLVDQGYKIACCSNSIRKTVLTVLSKLGIIEYFDLILSNEDVKNSKPHPEIYWKAISMVGCLPEETLIIEVSPFGLLAASRSKSHVMRVESPCVGCVWFFFEHLNNQVNMTPKWKNEKLNVLIPMAGAGSRFEQAGYTFPKPLIEVNGKPMIQVVIENLNLDANYIYVVQKSHREKYNLDTLLNLLTPGCKIVETDGLTEGAACTALLAKDYIDNANPLFFANSDQFVEWDSNEFMYKMQETDADGGIVSFTATHPKWSFAKIDENGLVTEVAEKNPISDIATVGYYFWKHGSNTYQNQSSDFYLNDGSDLKDLKSDEYDFVMSTIVFQHICVHELRYQLKQEIYRVLKSGGLFSFQMGYGDINFTGHTRPNNYYDNSYGATGSNGSDDVRVTNEKDLISDLEKIGFKDITFEIKEPFLDGGHPNWIYVKCKK